MSTTSWVSALLVVIIIGLGAWWYTAQAPTTAPEVNNDAGMPDDGVAPSTTPAVIKVIHFEDGFGPATVTVAKGSTVTWDNQSGGSMWVASAMHPAHAAYSGTTLAQHCNDAADVSFDQCKNGDTYSFTFDKAGTWAYHNHSNASQFGKVIVVE